jgi:hypothetical protein
VVVKGVFGCEIKIKGKKVEGKNVKSRKVDGKLVGSEIIFRLFDLSESEKKMR